MNDTLRRFATVALLGFASWLLGGCGAKSDVNDPAAGVASKLTPIRFQTDWYPQAEHGGFYQAKARGFYEEAGLDVTILAGGPGPTVSQKVAAGAADIAMGRSDDVMMQVAQGLPFVIIGCFMQHDPQAILVHASSPVRRFEDLDGTTIMAVPGSNWIGYLKARFQIDFKVIPSNFGIAQFMADPAFIQQCFITNEPYYVRENGAECRTLLLADSGFDPYRIIYTTRRFASRHPDAVRAFVAAATRGWDDFMNGDPTPAKTLIAPRNEQMTEGFMDYSIRSMREHQLIGGDPEKGETVGLLTRERLQEQLDQLLKLKLLKKPLELDVVVDFTFLPSALRDKAGE